MTQVKQADTNLIKEAYGVIKEPEIVKMQADNIEINSKRSKIPVETIEDSPRHIGVIIKRASKAHNKTLRY